MQIYFKYLCDLMQHVKLRIVVSRQKSVTKIRKPVIRFENR